MLTPLSVPALAIVVAMLAPALAIKITWPSETRQCDYIPISWTNGTEPYTFWLLPIGGMPLRWILTGAVELNTTLPLMLDAGTNYIVVGTDATDDGQFLSYSSSEINTVLPSNDSSCVALQFSAQYSFHVSGTANQCSSGFLITWLDASNVGPYFFTVFPLDQSFTPFDVSLGNETTGTYDWTVSLPEGTRFSIGMGSKDGHYRSGIGGIYQVGPGSSSSCVKISVEPTGAWPSGISTNQLSPATSTYGSSASSTASATSTATTSAAGGSGKKTNSGAIAGGVVGGVAAVVIVAVCIWFFLRRRRRAQTPITPVDLGDDDHGTGDNSGPATRELYHEIVPFSTAAGSASGATGSAAGHEQHALVNIPSSGQMSPTPGGSRQPLESLAPDAHSASGIPSQSSSSPSSSVPPHGLPPQMSRDSKSTPSLPPQGVQRTMSEEERPFLGGTSSPGLPGSPEEVGTPSFWRHEDAGRVEDRVMVELPPLYTKVASDVTGGDVARGEDEAR